MLIPNLGTDPIDSFYCHFDTSMPCAVLFLLMSRFFHQTKYFSLKPSPVFKIYTFPSLSSTFLLIHLGTAMDLHRNQDSALLYNIYAFTPCMDHFIMINLIIMHYSTVLLTFLGFIRLWHDTLLLIMIHIFVCT